MTSTLSLAAFTYYLAFSSVFIFLFSDFVFVFEGEMNNGEVRRPNKIVRYKPIDPMAQPASAEDSIPEYMNVLGMIFSMMGLMMRLKWCSWVALICSCVSFANMRASDDTKQVVSSFMLSISAVVMSYLQNPTPIVPPWA